MAATARLDVVAIGNAIVDVLARTDDALIAAEGLTKGSMRLIDAAEAERLYAAMGPAVEMSGGSAANTLAGMAALGRRCGFIGQVADDQLGSVFAHDLTALGVDYTTAARAGDPPTARCLILVTPDGQRTMNTYLGASQFLPESAGPTPMRLRQDALQVATRIMQEVVAIAGRSEEGRGTVGSVQVWPNSRNVVPGEVTFSIDMRNLSDALVDEMDRQLRAFIAEVERESGLQVALKQVSHYPAAPFDAECQQAIADAAQRLGYPARPIVSGAGHDAVYMSYLAPTGMIFIPCKDGISHNEIEYASPEHVAAGANVLLQVMLQYARPV